MAVIKAKPEKFVPLALGAIQRELITPMVVTRVGNTTFNNALNDTVTIRVGELRAVARDYEWRTRTAPIQMDDIQGGEGIAIKLDTHITSATSLTLEHLTLDDIDFTNEVLVPQATAVAGRLESKVIAALQAAPFKREMEVPAGSDPHLVAVEARRLLNADKIAPKAGRFFLIGSDVEAEWLTSDRLSKYDSTGQTGTPALRDAIIGRLAGIPVVVSETLPADFAMLLHRTALVLGNVAPVVPQGARIGRRTALNGMAMTWLQDYDADYARDRSLFHTFAGITSVQDERDANGVLLPEEQLTNNVRGVRINYTGLGPVFPPVVTP